MAPRIVIAILAALVIVAIVVIRRDPTPPPPSEPSHGRSLYDRLGKAFPIAAVVDRFSDEILKSPIVGVDSPNPALRQWSRKQAAERLPGLKFMRTLWVVDIAGGPQRYGGTKPGTSRLDLSAAHRHLHITGQEFDEVARILAETLDHFHIPEKERAEVLGAFSAHKTDIVGDGHSKFTVTARGPDLGWWPNAGCPPVSCPFA